MRALTFAVVLLLALLAVPAHGAPCPPPAAGSTIGIVDATDRDAWLRQQLANEQQRVRVWTYGWLVESVALGAGQLAALPFLGHTTRIDAAVGGIGSLIGGAPLVLLPMKLAHADLAPGSLGTCEGLAWRERLLQDNAADEAFGRSLVAQIASLGYSAALALVLGLGWGHWVTAAITLAVGIGISEARIFSQPAGSIADWASYASPEPSLYFGAAPPKEGKPLTWVMGTAF